MRLRNSLVAFGVSAAAVVGGYAGLHEAVALKNQHEQQIACQKPEFAGKVACRQQIITPELTHQTHNSELIYAWIGGVGLGLGAMGMMGAYGAALGSSTPAPAPRRRPPASS